MSGEWIKGYYGNIDHADILKAQLLGLLHGLQKCSNVLCVSDSLHAVQLIKKKVHSYNAHYHIVERIRDFLKEDWRLELKHSLHEGN